MAKSHLHVPTMRYKNTGDICYRSWSEFAERITDYDPQEVADETLLTFFPQKRHSDSLLLQFSNALEKQGRFKYRLDMSFKTASKFIDADNYLHESDKLSLAKLLIKKKYFWQRIFYSKAAVDYAVSKFLEFASPIKEAHEWIYNPPLISTGQGKVTIASELMREFEQHYGGYMELVYLLTNGDFTKMDEVTEWSLERFLFQGEYLLRKKRIESIN